MLDLFKDSIGKYAMIRTNTAGVHFGILESAESNHADAYDVKLTSARRIYSWTGAFTLSELASIGSTRNDSKISVPIPGIYLKAIEIIPMTDEAVKNLNDIKPFKP